LEARSNRFQLIKKLGHKGYYCFGCKKSTLIVNSIDDIPCTGTCRRSLNFGNVGISIGTIMTKTEIATTVKRNTYSCLFGNQIWGCSVILITPFYENNNIEYLFDQNNPRLCISGVGGRSLKPNGQIIQSYNQVEWQNRSLIVSQEQDLPIRLLVKHPWNLKGDKYMYLGLWKITTSTYKESFYQNSTRGFKMYFFELVPFNHLEYQNFLKSKVLQISNEIASNKIC